MYSSSTCCGENVSGGLGWFAAAMAAVPVVTQAYSSMTGGDAGGDHCWTRYGNRPFAEPCPNTPNYDAVARAVARAPDPDINKIIGYLLGGNAGSGPKSRAELQRPECIPFWVKAILGGKGCVASKYPEAPAWFLGVVKAYGAPSTEAEAKPGSSIPLAFQKAGINALPILALGALILFGPRLLKK